MDDNTIKSLNFDAVCLPPDKQIPLHSQSTWELSCVITGEGNEFAALLQGAGVAASLIQTRGTMHGFDMAQRSEITQRQISERCKWLGEW